MGIPILVTWNFYIENTPLGMACLSLDTHIYIHGSWWRHQMETFSALLALCEGNSPVTDEFPSQRPVTRSFEVFFDLRINGWVNNREADDLRRHRAHYDVTVMCASNCCKLRQPKLMSMPDNDENTTRLLYNILTKSQFMCNKNIAISVYILLF